MKNKKANMKKKRKKLKWVVWGVVILVIIILIAVFGRGKGVQVRTAAASKGTIRAYVEERARTTLPRVYRITMPFNGRVEPITMEEGDRVAKGEVVATLDAENLTTALEQFEETVRASGQAVKAADQQVVANRALEAYAKWFAAAQEKLYPDKLISEMDMKEATRDATEAEAATQESLLTYYAFVALDAATRLLPVPIRRDLARTKLKSPIGGVVLKRHFQNEVVLSAGQTLLEIGVPESLEVTADILSTDAVGVRPGDSVEIFGPTVGKKPLRGSVKKVHPEAFTKVSSLGVEEQRVPVEITIDPGDMKTLREAGSTLGVEYRVRVRIFTDSRSDAIIIPYPAIFRGSGGEWQVFVVNEGRAERKKVTTGLTNDLQAEVTKGLSTGERVILAPPTTLQSGDRVEIEEAY